jgi:murein L,D-transpeptidase YcbB/YkuD
MARMPGAAWKPIDVNHSSGGMGTIHGVTLHIMDGTLAGTNSWFRNPAAQASSHFGTGRDGDLYQWVDTRDKAWAQAAGNPNWISIENEGRGGDTLTDAQLDRCAQVLAWAHQAHGVPLQTTSSTTGRGLGHHAMGGSAWGGHTSCPGTRIVAQKTEIVRRAKAIVGEKPAHDPTPASGSKAPKFSGRLLAYPPIVRGDDVRTWQSQMKHRGWDIDVDGAYGPGSRDVCVAFQQEKGLDDDGVVGKLTWVAAWEEPVT